MQAFIGKKIRCKQCSAIILVGTGNVSPAPPPVTPMSVPPSPPIMPPVSVTPVVPSPAPVTEPPPVVEFSEPKTIALPTPVSATQALRLELENAKSKVKATEDRAVVAEQRAQVAEKALHELAAKQAGELNAANHKVATLEKELDDFRSFAGEVANDDEREIAMAEKRITSLKERLTRFTV
jgi:type IV secretory pathway VirB10-like protein